MNIDSRKIMVGDMRIDVVQKDIKHLHLSVYPPRGRVRIAAPLHMDLDTIRVYAISKLDWIKRHHAKFIQQEREAPREFISRESHYYLGKRYLLDVRESDVPPRVTLTHETIELRVRRGSSPEMRKTVMENWYRKRLKEIVPPYIARWEPRLKVKVGAFAVRKMKTKWGTCSREAGRIWLNLELAKKSRHCIEYIVVHEMVHLLERKHNEVFIAYMDKSLPRWRSYKEELNRGPLSHETWRY